MRDRVEQAAGLIRRAQHVAVFTGAGVSKENRGRPMSGAGLMAWWWRFVAWGFEQLYTRFAWAYDAVAWAVSRGRWNEWGRAAIPRLTGRRVLEIGSGPGHLVAAMADAGFEVSAIEVSAEMVEFARRRLCRRELKAGLVRGRAEALPWPDAWFESLVMTFPAGFVVRPETLREIRRVLRPGGRLVIVDGAWQRPDLYGRIVNLAFRLTHGGGGTGATIADLFERTGFAVTREVQHWPDSSAEILVATKHGV